MELYLNSCVPEEVEEIASWGILDGVTMNPTMVAAKGGDFVANFKRICSIFPTRVFTQVVSRSADAMVEEAKHLNSLGPNVAVKIHANVEGSGRFARSRKAPTFPCA